MKTHQGIVTPALMRQFPSGTAAATFADWVANHVGLEQMLGVAGFLAPELVELKGCLFWDRHVAEKLESIEPSTPFGDDLETAERYYNIVNLAELFLASADEAVHRIELVVEFGRVLEHFWSAALKARFPGRVYRFEVSFDLFDEEGLCLTFWQDRDGGALENGETRAGHAENP